MVGVACAPICAASRWSSAMRAFAFRSGSRPRSAAGRARCRALPARTGRATARAAPRRARSCICQNLPCSRRLGGLGGRERVRVERERLVLPDHPTLSAYSFCTRSRSARRARRTALEVGEEHDRHRRLRFRAPGRPRESAGAGRERVAGPPRRPGPGGGRRGEFALHAFS